VRRVLTAGRLLPPPLGRDLARELAVEEEEDLQELEERRGEVEVEDREDGAEDDLVEHHEGEGEGEVLLGRPVVQAAVLLYGTVLRPRAREDEEHPDVLLVELDGALADVVPFDLLLALLALLGVHVKVAQLLGPLRVRGAARATPGTPGSERAQGVSRASARRGGTRLGSHGDAYSPDVT